MKVFGNFKIGLNFYNYKKLSNQKYNKQISQNNENDLNDKYLNALALANKSTVSFCSRADRVKILDAVKEKVIEMHKSGKTGEQIAKEMKCSSRTVYSALDRWGVPRTLRGQVDADTVIELYKSNNSVAEIADKMQCSDGTIYRILHKYVLIPNKQTAHDSLIKRNKDKIIELFLQGKMQVQIAQEIGCSPSAISRVLDEWNIERPSFAQQNKDKIIALYNSGKTPVQIADEIGCHHTTVRDALKAWNIKPRQATKNKSEIIALFESGKTYDEIAQMLNCSSKRIRAVLKSWGYNPEPSITNKNKDKIIRMFNDGWSYQYIADEIGCDIAAIYRAIKKWGLSRKK